MPSMPTEDKTDIHNSSWDYHNENENEHEKRNFTSTPTPQTHTWFENLAYSSHLAVESDPYQLPEILETSKAEVSAVPYQPQYYLSILNDDAPSSPREAAGRKTSLRYISQTDVHCIGRRLWCILFDRLSNVWVTKGNRNFWNHCSFSFWQRLSQAQMPYFCWLFKAVGSGLVQKHWLCTGMMHTIVWTQITVM